MPSEDKKPQHWPFTDGTAETDAVASFRAAMERKRARESMQAVNREHMRSDRLIVGGRAHTKKHGLS